MERLNAHISGMHCASCVSRLEKTLGEQPGVETVTVNLATEEARISFDANLTNADALAKSIEPLGYGLHPKMPAAHEHGAPAVSGHDHTASSATELTALKTKVLSSIPLVILAVGMMAWDVLAKLKIVPEMTENVYEFAHHLLPIMASYMLFVVGTSYLKGLWRFIKHGAADMDTLVGLGTSVAFLYSFFLTALEIPLGPYVDVKVTYYDVTIVVIGLITLGKFLEARAKAKTGSAIKQLLGLQAKTATVLRDNTELTIAIDDVLKGDVVVVKPGMKIPVDGTVLDGNSYLDESMLTGEAVPVAKTTGDKVSAGTINTTGSFTFTATGIGADTLLARIIALVEEAQGSKAPIQRLADKISSIFVPIVLVIAVASLLAWLFIGSQFLPLSMAISYGVVSLVSVLVIACPCALGLATPTAIMVGVGRGASLGILIKNAEVLERLHKITTLVIDKTGTLTEGKPQVTSLEIVGSDSESTLLSRLAGLEKNSEHPLADAIGRYAASKNATPAVVSDFENLPGQGVRGTIDGQVYYAGGPNLLKRLNLAVPKHSTENAATVIYLTNETEIQLAAMIGDKIKNEAVSALKQLRSLNIKIVMATGDNRVVAESVARELGIERFVAEVLPADKLALVKELQAAGEIVAMAGDGVNDAPALAQADIGIAMATGADVAIETSDVALLHGDIQKIAQAIELSRGTMSTVKQNLFWAFAYNVIGIPLATGLFFPLFGWLLSPVFAGFAMAMSSVSVVANSLRLKAKRF